MLTDVDALMQKAKDLVAIAERIQTAKKNEKTDVPSSELTSYLLQIGISSPVTRESAGSHYHTELSKQLCDFCLKVMPRVGQMITLPDLYCLFNRARGTGKWLMLEFYDSLRNDIA